MHAYQGCLGGSGPLSGPLTSVTLPAPFSMFLPGQGPENPLSLGPSLFERHRIGVQSCPKGIVYDDYRNWLSRCDVESRRERQGAETRFEECY
ncbi:hypothetical protein L249_8765 [Ophiocordyceps polyrhachis-furcata BCC 54312]|uniref:Uncharacterized protein n=1 Tax=Ophiocordyceps polyrhachis-furcata BCC 54312 TaxID=1330021 RepID=A0A367L655_9HYPO|nr:hypothetical protein L249_8765 [Ophiocordyceps polyrhachis-furcata BCC 54312]